MKNQMTPLTIAIKAKPKIGLVPIKDSITVINFNVNTSYTMEYLPSVAQIQGLCESFLHKLSLCIC